MGSTCTAISTKFLLEMLEILKWTKTRNSTYETYYKIWKSFNSFLTKLDRKPKCWEDRVVLFCVYHINKGTQLQTLKSYVSAIKYILTLVNYQLDCNMLLLNTLTKACRLENDRVQLRLPISCKLLELILFEIARVYGNKQPYLAILYQSILLIGYYGLFRIGELTVGEQGSNIQSRQKMSILHSTRIKS